MIYQVLKQLGLSDKESKIYLALLEIGEQPVSVVAKKSLLNRTTSYDILRSLTKKGLVSSFIKKNVQFYSASDPKSFFSYLNRQENDIQTKKDVLNKNLDLLTQINPNSQIRPKVKFFEGFAGIVNVYNESLKSDFILSFINTTIYPDELNDFIYNEYIPQRIEKGIPIKEIAPNSDSIKSANRKSNTKLRTTKYLPVTLGISIEINIYDNKVAFMSFEDGKYVGIIIENEEIYKAMSNIHKACWMFAGQLNL